MGVLGQLCFSLCYYTAIPLVGISTACILLYLSPIFVMLLGVLIFHEKLGLPGFVGILLVLGSIVLMNRPAKEK